MERGGEEDTRSRRAEVGGAGGGLRSDADPGDGHPEFYLLLSNISKRQNFGTLLRSACAFGVSEVLVVGEKRLRTFGSKGTLSHLSITHYDNLDEAVEIIRENEMDIVGVEISENSRPVYPHPFRRSTAFILGNEWMGLSEKLVGVCDYLLHIPMYGCGTASLNVAVAGSIVFQHFGIWAKYAEARKEGSKYLLEEDRPRGRMRRYLVPSKLGRFPVGAKRCLPQLTRLLFVREKGNREEKTRKEVSGQKIRVL
ncbi:OBP33pep like protein [Cryptosporidium ryanae]|uniref:OBP33pep like protein n=1 Tax=Cryptosporidium ryanae TaxID=515981 RepID=UPI003519E51E|nr:OBP33pep like protein [Cryptosporidium ryanae]